jgi:hypothetical protein
MRSIFIGIGSRAARIVNEILRNSKDPLSPDLLPIDIIARKGRKPYDVEVEVTKEGARINPRKKEEGHYYYMVDPGTYNIHLKMPEGDLWKIEEIEDKGKRIEVSVPEAKPSKPSRFSRELKTLVLGKLAGLIPVAMDINMLPYCLLIVIMGILPEIGADRVKVDGTAKKGGFLSLVGTFGLVLGWFACYKALPLGGISILPEIPYMGALSVLSSMIGEVAAYIYLLLTKPVRGIPVLKEFYSILKLIAIMFIGSLIGGLLGALIIWLLHMNILLNDLLNAWASLFAYSLISFIISIFVAWAFYKLWRYNLRKFWKSATLGAMSFLIMLAAGLYLSVHGLAILKAVSTVPDGLYIPSIALAVASFLGYYYFRKISPVIEVVQEDIPIPRVPHESYKGEVVAFVLQQQDQTLDCVDAQEKEAKEYGISLKHIIPQAPEIPRFVRDVASSMKQVKRVIWDRTGKPLDAVFVLMDMEVRETIDPEDPAVLTSLWLSSAISDLVSVPSILLLILPERPMREATPALSCAPAEGLAPLDPSFREYVMKQLECYDGLILVDPAHLTPGVMGIGNVEKLLTEEIVRRICPLLEPGSPDVVSASGVDSQHVINGIRGTNKGARGISVVGFSSTEMPKYDRNAVSMVVRESLMNTTAKVEPKDARSVFVLARGDKDLMSISDIYYSVKALYKGSVSAFDVETGERGRLEIVSVLSGVMPDSLPIWRFWKPLEREIEEEKRELKRKVEEKIEEIDRELGEMSEEEKEEIKRRIEEERRRIEEIGGKERAEEVKREEAEWKRDTGEEAEWRPALEAERAEEELKLGRKTDFTRVDAERLERIIIGN